MAIVRLIGGFLVGAVLSGVTAAAISVYWIRDLEDKFRDSPSVAFELEMWGLAVVCIVGVVVAIITSLFYSRHLVATPRALAISVLGGAAYPVLPRLLFAPLQQLLHVENPIFPVVGCFYLAAFPVLVVLALQRENLGHVPRTL